MIRQRSAYLLVGLTLLLASRAWSYQTPQDAQGWSQFRGPNGSGIATTSKLPVEFNRDKHLKWMTKLPEGHSSPVVFEQYIFVTAIENDSLLTICLDKANGAELWRRSVSRERKERIDSRNNPASPTPVVDASGVYVFFPDVGLIGYSTSGELKWQTKLGPFSNLYGMGASPIICNGRLILMCDQNLDSYIAAFDLKDGQLIWKTMRPEATSGHCSPIIYQPPQGEPQIIAVGSFYLTSYSVASGSKLWWVGGLCFEMKSTPIIHNNLVYINGYGSPQNEEDASFKIGDFGDVVAKQDSNGDGKLNLAELPDALSKDFFPAVDLDGDASLDSREWDYFRSSLASKNSLMAIRLNGSGDMTAKNIVWKYFRNIPQLPSPVLTNDKLFMINDAGIVSCLDSNKGTLLKRGRLQGAAGNIYASPVVADNKIFFITQDGKVAVTDTSSEFNILAVNDLQESCYATPAFDNNRVYIRTQRALYAFGL